MTDAALSLTEVADELGVHYMTAYRYVRLGLLPAAKVGSSWVVTAADLETFRSSSRSGSGRRPGRASRGDGKWPHRFEARLVAGDARGAWGVLEAALAGGADLETLYLQVIAPALRGVGDRWAAGEIDVAVEHRASTIVTKALGRLAPRMVKRGRSRGTVILGAAPGERHGLPLTLVADLVRGAGFDVDDLGPDVPAPSFAAAAAGADRLVAVGVSATTDGLDEGVVAAIRAVRDRLGSVPVLLGGAAIADETEALARGADHWGSDALAVVAVLEAVTTER